MLVLGITAPHAAGYTFLGLLVAAALGGWGATRVPVLRLAAVGWLATSLGLIVATLVLEVLAVL